MSVERVLGVEPLSIRSSLGSRPEEVTLSIKVILREYMKEIEDLMIKERLEIFTSNFNTS
jgi:hypothetical protein